MDTVQPLTGERADSEGIPAGDAPDHLETETSTPQYRNQDAGQDLKIELAETCYTANRAGGPMSTESSRRRALRLVSADGIAPRTKDSPPSLNPKVPFGTNYGTRRESYLRN